MVCAPAPNSTGTPAALSSLAILKNYFAQTGLVTISIVEVYPGAGVPNVQTLAFRRPYCDSEQWPVR